MEVRKCSAMERLSSVFPTPVGPIRTIRVSGMVFIKERGGRVTSAPVKINSFLAHKGPVRRHRPYQILRDQSLPYRSPGRRRNSRLYPDFRYCFCHHFVKVDGLFRGFSGFARTHCFVKVFAGDDFRQFNENTRSANGSNTYSNFCFSSSTKSLKRVSLMM